MQQLTCLSCRHFRRHYVLDDSSAMPTTCGHCVAVRLKHRRIDTLACAHFQPREDAPLPDREKILHYLSTEMLDYIRSLPLPPKIER